MARQIAGFLAMTTLVGCQSAAMIDPIARIQADARQMYIGKQRWVGTTPIALCADDALTDCKTKLHTGSLTIEDRQPPDVVNGKHVSGFYRVRTGDGKTGYISLLDYGDTEDEFAHKRRVAAKADCDKRGGVAVGMTASQVRASCWGKPEKVNSTVSQHARREQWVYSIGHYVYLTDGVVTSIQTASR